MSLVVDRQFDRAGRHVLKGEISLKMLVDPVCTPGDRLAIKKCQLRRRHADQIVQKLADPSISVSWGGWLTFDGDGRGGVPQSRAFQGRGGVRGKAARARPRPADRRT